MQTFQNLVEDGVRYLEGADAVDSGKWTVDAAAFTTWMQTVLDLIRISTLAQLPYTFLHQFLVNTLQWINPCSFCGTHGLDCTYVSPHGSDPADLARLRMLSAALRSRAKLCPQRGQVTCRTDRSNSGKVSSQQKERWLV